MNDSKERVIWRPELPAFIEDFKNPLCADCIKKGREIVDVCPIDKRKARHTKIAHGDGYIFGCTKKKTLIGGPASHLAILARHVENLNLLDRYQRMLDAVYEKNQKRLLHNIEGHDAHIIQEFETIASGEEMAGASGRHRELIVGKLQADRFGSARSLLKMFQSAIGIKNEIIVYQRLFLNREWKEERATYRAHAVVMNTAYKFFEDFTERNIRLNVGECWEDIEVDYECASIILYHIIDNARKYALMGRPIGIEFATEGKILWVRFSMISVAVEPDEIERIYEEGYSGKNVVKMGRQGRGIGMTIIREIARRTGIRFEAKWNVSGERMLIEDTEYAQNELSIGLPLP